MAVPPTVRDADPERDAGACAAIYAPFVNYGAVSFEEVAPDSAAFAGRITALSARFSSASRPAW